jgi:hypothetical protein
MQGNSNESIRRLSTKDSSTEKQGKEETGKCAIDRLSPKQNFSTKEKGVRAFKLDKQRADHSPNKAKLSPDSWLGPLGDQLEPKPALTPKSSRLRCQSQAGLDANVKPASRSRLTKVKRAWMPKLSRLGCQS